MSTPRNPPDAPPHPPQPIVTATDGVRRFKENAIVRELLDFAISHGFGMNEIAIRRYDAADRVQFAQLIGYSVSGFSDLSYVSDAEYDRATKGEP